MKWEPVGKHAPSGKRGKKSGCLIALVVVVAIAVIGGISQCAGGGKKGERLEWPATGLASMLPEPDSEWGEVHTNSDDRLWVDVNEFSQSAFDAYVDQCKEKGFTVDADDALGYSAYSEEGYYLDLSYFESSEEMSISLDAPVEMGTITWPTMGAGALVPAPVSTTGKINSDSSTFFSATIGETGPADYSSYVDACIAAGFNIDYHKGEDSFYGDDAAGNHVSVQHKGANMMDITVNAVDESATPTEETPAEEAPAEQPAETEAPVTPGEPVETGSASDFRTMVDEYEAFMNSYCDFMEKYSSDSGNAVSMAIDYASMMAQYGDWATKMDAVDESALSAEDSQYFLDAQTRINQRLWSIGLS